MLYHTIDIIMTETELFAIRYRINQAVQIPDLLWQPLITKTNDHTSGKSLSGISSGEFTRELDKEPLLN